MSHPTTFDARKRGGLRTSSPQVCYWRSAFAVLPLQDGKYVVNVDCPGGMAYTSTRSFNKGSNAWLNMGDGETVSHWLDGLVDVPVLRGMGSL